MRLLICLFLAVTLIPNRPQAQDKIFTLSAPQSLKDTGLLDYLLPRFSLKTAVRINRVGANTPADVDLNDTGNGAVVFQGPNALWYIYVINETAAVTRFISWLNSDNGKRAIIGFQPNGTAPFTVPETAAPKITETRLEGDIDQGERLSLANCGRCHVVNETNRMKAIGSTPSFALIRTFANWQYRVSSFYVLKPHPSFTQISNVTEPFDPQRPPPIVPLSLTLDNIDDILAYIETIVPADLGAPLQSQ